ncbi:hypothetical protein GPZ77_31255 [Streptomyces sp. QHH-9511]|uniref:hypothetical protein n=1 Tax=Streptomyces sp. QHH-9511 TaxID=2684468 RepID=UPI0013165691|nr:hypothetical protein [Streptomyces sp. QHH-9511]QGZ52231.1 hypothetical protein GPZ77_31255 [Streptomyces sp. QHH-9511]
MSGPDDHQSGRDREPRRGQDRRRRAYGLIWQTAAENALIRAFVEAVTERL